jgi:pantoate--beta-alanine ligase
VAPDVAFFGQKDAQQAIVIQRMVADLNVPLEIAVCPTVREPDGLAVSSRNQYLSAQHRRDATIIYRALETCRRMVESGERSAHEIRGVIQSTLSQVPGLEVEYVEIVSVESLQEIDPLTGNVLVAIAARLGSTRLIDNIRLDIR